MEKKVHYSRAGYNENYTYTSVCGKTVKTHQDKEDSSVHPEETTCNECKKTKEYKTDLEDSKLIAGSVVRRIYLESDILQADEFRRAQRKAATYIKEQKNLQVVDRVFLKSF